MLAGAGEDRKASEEELQILANCYQRQKDTAGYVGAIEKLVVFYPKKDYWVDLLSHVQRKPGFASDRLGIHVYRLRMAIGLPLDTNDYMEMAQLALQAGVPAEAKSIVDKGYDAKALGVGAQAERQQRLRDLINKSLADSQKNRAKDEADASASKDGNELVKVGLNYVYEGKADKGLTLIDQGIKRGGLRRPDDAKLLYGEALLAAGQRVPRRHRVQGCEGHGRHSRRRPPLDPAGTRVTARVTGSEPFSRKKGTDPFYKKPGPAPGFSFQSHCRIFPTTRPGRNRFRGEPAVVVQFVRQPVIDAA